MVTQSGTSGSVVATATVTNTGKMKGDEVVFLYKQSAAVEASWAGNGSAALQSHRPSPHKELIGFERVTLAPGESKTVTFTVTPEKVSTVDRYGTRHIVSGRQTLMFSRGHGPEKSVPLDVRVRADGGAHRSDGRIVFSTLEGIFGKSAADLGLEVEKPVKNKF